MKAIQYLLAFSASSFMLIQQSVAHSLHSNNHPVSISAGASNPEITIKRTAEVGRLIFEASGRPNSEISIYLFDMGGKLVKQASFKINEKMSLEALPRGSYFFEVFCNDTRIKNGSVRVP